MLEKKERAFREMQNKYTATQALQSAGLKNGEETQGRSIFINRDTPDGWRVDVNGRRIGRA